MKSPRPAGTPPVAGPAGALAGGQVEEQLAHGLEDVDTGEQLLGFGLLDDQGSGGAHAISGMDKQFVHSGL